MPHLYFVGTSRGCSCDFGISSKEQPTDSAKGLDQKPGGKIRELFGIQKKWLEREKLRLNKTAFETANFERQTLVLIKLIEDSCTTNTPVEMYCCWAGAYSQPAEDLTERILDVDAMKKDFKIELNELITFKKEKADTK